MRYCVTSLNWQTVSYNDSRKYPEESLKIKTKLHTFVCSRYETCWKCTLATTILRYKVAKVKTRPIGVCINILWNIVKSIKAYREKLYGAISKWFIVWLYRADGREWCICMQTWYELPYTAISVHECAHTKALYNYVRILAWLSYALPHRLSNTNIGKIN